MKFTKMQGNGNDYVYINCFDEVVSDPENLSIKMSNRNFGIGGDGIVLIMPSEVADFRMRMFNADGSEGNMCGNASCCIGKYVFERGLTKKDSITLETKSGIKNIQLHIKNVNNENIVDKVTVDMGEPILEPENIPVVYDDNLKNSENPKNIVINKELLVIDKILKFTCVSMGNPHAVTVWNGEIDGADVEKYGKIIEINKDFPERVNVEFVNIIDENNLIMRVWERGSGETLACGTGTCATVVASILNGYCKKDTLVNVKLQGGNLAVLWNSKNNHVYLTGEGAFSFDGVWLK